MNKRILERIMRGEDPRELGRRGGLKAASNRRSRKAAAERKERNDRICQDAWWNK